MTRLKISVIQIVEGLFGGIARDCAFFPERYETDSNWKVELEEKTYSAIVFNTHQRTGNLMK